MSSPGITTLAQIRSIIRTQANVENSQFVTDAELLTYINLDAQELYGILVTSFNDSYFLAAPYAFTTDGVSTNYPLPADFFKLKGVDLSLTGGSNTFITLKPFNFRERNRLNNAWIASPVFNMLQNVRYSVQGSNLMLTPLASANQFVQVWYTPRFTPLVADTDTLDGVNGWEGYIIASVCARIAAKQEDDPSPWLNQKAQLLQRITEEAAQRNEGDPTTVSDVYNDSGWGQDW